MSLKTICALGLMLAMASCAKHISYRDAYKFSRHSYAPKNEDTVTKQSPAIPGEPPEVFVATLDSGPSPTLDVHPTQPARKTLDKKPFSQKLIYEKKTFPKFISKAEPQRSKNWAAITGFVLGLLMFPFGILTIIPGIIFSVIGLRSEKPRLAIVGLVLNIFAIFFTIWWISISIVE